jgi:NAD-dependent dihydropyrimidine dehydrogenase PreA subunit
MPPKIDGSKCNGCKTCVDICPVQALVMEDGKAKLKNKNDCIDCRACEAQCLKEAISFED